MAMPLHGKTRRLPVLERKVLAGRGVRTAEHVVFCSAREETVPLATSFQHPLAPIEFGESSHGAEDLRRAQTLPT